MNKAILSLAATAAALVCVSSAAGAAPSQQRYQPLHQRTAMLEQKINQGARSGALTRSEADSLRVGLARIKLIEAQYRRGGINRFEQQDLDRRFDNLARHVRVEKNDRDTRGDRFERNRGNGNGGYADRGNHSERGYRR